MICKLSTCNSPVVCLHGSIYELINENKPDMLQGSSCVPWCSMTNSVAVLAAQLELLWPCDGAVPTAAADLSAFDVLL
jgi:hypothetical protein